MTAPGLREAFDTALDGWMKVFGQSPLAVRLPSAFLGLLAVAVIYAIGRTLFGGRVAAAGGLLAAVSPFQVYYGQEARMYAALSLAGALAVLAVARMARSVRPLPRQCYMRRRSEG